MSHLTAIRRSLLFLGLSLVSLSLEAQFAFHPREGALDITLDDQPIATYVWDDPDTTRPYLKQIRTPDGIQVSRNHPPQPGDYQDHETYHPGIWWGFGDVATNDYWRMKARIRGGEFVAGPTGGRQRATFAVKNQLLVNGGDEVFVEQICHYTFLRRDHGVLLVAESTFLERAEDYWLGDQEEMGLAFRVRSDLAIERNEASQILNANGSTDLKTIRTTQSDWTDYSGPAEDRYLGMMLMSDPKNFRRPWWHAVKSGLLVANAFGQNELNGRGKKRESWLVKAGERFCIRYGVLIHSHESQAEFDRTRAYQDFVESLKSIESVASHRPQPSQAQLPQVPEGFTVSAFAREPMIFKPTALCFDAKGRLMIGQGPQYPKHHETFPTDSVYLLIDRDDDGVADEAKPFAQGFNSIQGLAWKGNDLYVANAPELTVVRDLDGDDEADEYIVVYTDLGNREHALHGLNWGPDGKLYLSKGNSKGHNQPDKFPGIAPKPFRELWDVADPPGAPDFYPPQSYTKYTYKKSFHDPGDDWGREGGILRCDPMGSNLEIVSRGMRNPWDMTLDDEFNWLATDNDQSQGDRIIAPVFGTHFGWGHPYSNHWTGIDHLPTAPISGPVFHGSGTGIIYYDHPQFPESYRNVFFINDWLDGTYVYRPTWQGSLRMPRGGKWEPFATRGELHYRPTDLEFGPDGSIYSCGWGGDYHYQPGEEGSWVYRIVAETNPIPSKSEWLKQKYHLPYSAWTVDQLLEDLRQSILPVWRVNAQDELVRRGLSVRDELLSFLQNDPGSTAQQTWVLWTLGRIGPDDPTTRSWLTSQVSHEQADLNTRVQSVRILTHWIRNQHHTKPLPDTIVQLLRSPTPRLRLAAIQAIWQAKQNQFLSAVIDWLPNETDRLNYYCAWRALRELGTPNHRKNLLNDPRPRVRLAALLGLLENFELNLDEAMAVAEKDTDPEVQEWISTWALNPSPPKKMPNEQSRIEQERSVTIKELIDKTESATSPRMRSLFLTMISRATYRRDNEWDSIHKFYQSLPSGPERARVLPVLARTDKAKPILWDALGGSPELSSAAIQGFLTLSAEGRLSADQVANYLVKQLSSPTSTGTQRAAVETLARLRFIPHWSPSTDWDNTLLKLYREVADDRIRGKILEAMAKIDIEKLTNSTPLTRLIESISAQPDPRLYPGLRALSDKLGFELQLDPARSASTTGVQAALKNADPDRGRDLFFSESGATGCALCHQIQGKGNRFAPDLSSIGNRSDQATIIQSILEPSAAITEGFQLQHIATRTQTLLGSVLEETSSELTLVDQAGQQTKIPTQDIVRRENLEQSAMPATFNLLGNEQIADLTAYLLTCRHPETTHSNRN